MPVNAGGGSSAIPDLGELQKDPVAALTKGFGWFASTVTKTAKGINDDFIQPTAKQVSPALAVLVILRCLLSIFQLRQL